MQPNVLIAQIDLGGAWRTEIFAGLSLLTIFMVMKFRRQIGWPLSLLWLWQLLQALYSFEYPSAPYGDINMAFMATGGQSFAESFMLPLALLSMKRETRFWLLDNMKWLMVYEAVCVWLRWPGVMVAPSFDTALMALYYPFAPLWLKALTLATIVKCHGATAVLIIVAQYAVWLFYDRKYSWRLVYALFGLSLVLGLAYYVQTDAYGLHVPFFSYGERLEKYAKYLTFWNQNWQFRMIGLGPGSFMWLSLMMDQFQGTLFLQMHSDWLQIAFELGIVGVALTLASVVWAVRRALRCRLRLAAIAGCVVFAIPYHPLRFAVTALLIGLIFSLVVDDVHDQVA